MKVLKRVKSFSKLLQIKKNNGDWPYPSFITQEQFDADKYYSSKHSMEYYCGKIIMFENLDYHFDGWYWDNWMFEKNTGPTKLELE